MIQLASASGNVAALVFFVLDLLHLDGDDFGAEQDRSECRSIRP
jgi:hypothetical protein